MNPRLQAYTILHTRKEDRISLQQDLPDQSFGCLAFGDDAMKKYLSSQVFSALRECIDKGNSLDREIATPVAKGMKKWASELGATHYAHWFQPLTGVTAEKHESFLAFKDGKAIEEFSGDELVQQNPDAASLPHSGLRTAFEARGFSAWDPGSPAFIFETDYGKTLCIPTIFVSNTGASLDYKIPLLKSISVLEKASLELIHFFDKSVKKVYPCMGAEQEFFLVDEAWFNLRPDLILTGRTVVGASPTSRLVKNHYFGSIPERVLGVLKQVEYEAHRLGIPLKTRHNEVAPGQFEVVPHFEELNIAIDHGQILMVLLDRVARKHRFRVLLHEKPFEGVNGSAKHNNWSLHTDKGRNLFSPGSKPEENLMFLTFFTAVLRAVSEYPDLLSASIANIGNDLRLGADEAPPKSIFVFVGQALGQVLEDIVNPPRKKKNVPLNPYLKIGIQKIPQLQVHHADTNRTSPIAFTGKKFEFRAVGSSTNSSHPMMVLNTIVAEQFSQVKYRVERKMARGRPQDLALLDIIKENIEASQKMRFDGDEFNDGWQKEIAKRKLKTISHTPQALKAYKSDKVRQLFEKQAIFTAQELQLRYDVLLDDYLHRVGVEQEVIDNLSRTQVLPVALAYLKAISGDNSFEQIAGSKETINKISEAVSSLFGCLSELDHLRKEIDNQDSSSQKGEMVVQRLVPLFQQIRNAVDDLEGLMPDNDWTLPKYREILFVN